MENLIQVMFVQLISGKLEHLNAKLVSPFGQVSRYPRKGATQLLAALKQLL